MVKETGWLTEFGEVSVQACSHSTRHHSIHAESNWTGLVSMIALFRRIAGEVAELLGYQFPDQLIESVTNHARRMRRGDFADGQIARFDAADSPGRWHTSWRVRRKLDGHEGTSETAPVARLNDSRYDIAAAEPDAWRHYDRDAPDPGYFQFDWLSARHPDLYHRFALTSDALVSELEQLVDLRGLDVIDVGAGTGRSAIGLARTAASVLAVDAYASVIDFGERAVHEAGLTNVRYRRGDRSQLPAPDSSVDAVVCCWAELDQVEAVRVLRPGGLLVHMGGHPTGPDELTPILAEDFPELVLANQQDSLPDPHRGAVDITLPASDWPDVPMGKDALHAHDFTYTADYGTVEEAAAIFGRLFGPRAAQYLLDRRQATVWSRLRIWYARVEK